MGSGPGMKVKTSLIVWSMLTLRLILEVQNRAKVSIDCTLRQVLARPYGLEPMIGLISAYFCLEKRCCLRHGLTCETGPEPEVQDIGPKEVDYAYIQGILLSFSQRSAHILA